MTLDQIKAAVDAGRTIHWANPSYQVIKDDFVGQYLIAFDRGGRRENYIGLTHQDGVTMNGHPSQFFDAEQPRFFMLIGRTIIFREVQRYNWTGIDCVRGVSLNGRKETVARVADVTFLMTEPDHSFCSIGRSVLPYPLVN